MADKAIITTKGLTDYDGELDGIADAIRAADSTVEVEVVDPKRMEPGRYGVVWGEILHVTLPMLEGYAAGKIIDAVIAQARKGSAAKQAGKPRPRPRFVVIFGPDGKEMKRISVDAEADEDPKGQGSTGEGANGGKPTNDEASSDSAPPAN